jgi:Flp pilus assembly protein TadG
MTHGSFNRRFRRIVAEFIGDRRGIAIVEFALILPILVLLYFGSVEISQAINVKRVTDLSASTIANLVSQYPSISISQTMPDILNAATAVLTPYPVANATVTVTCINIDAAGNATVAWSQSLNGKGLTVGNKMTLPAAFSLPNTSVIMGASTYTFNPVLDWLHFGTFNLTSSVYMFPRAASGTILLIP